MKFDGDENYFFREVIYCPLNDMKGTLAEMFDKLEIPKHKQIICDSGNELNKEEARKLKNAGYNVINAKKAAVLFRLALRLCKKVKYIIHENRLISNKNMKIILGKYGKEYRWTCQKIMETITFSMQ